ncbi:hypothetical protein [Nostoc sp. WHI]|uniref:hypothetical protein n=1 Tax=Nostoc sp. WHI TaxID=2650611 RepID=UPI0018C84FE2|nr:hypothetical protein [Nostoc sp. WHI]MBG1269266.1 hypothetical protein [Nostoc sp. WHI]
MHKCLVYRNFERSQNLTLIDSFLIVTFLGGDRSTLCHTSFLQISTILSVSPMRSHSKINM